MNKAMNDGLLLTSGILIALIAVVNGIIMWRGPDDRDYTVLWPLRRRSLPEGRHQFLPAPRRFFGATLAVVGTWILAAVVLMGIRGVVPVDGTRPSGEHATPGYGWVSLNLIVSVAAIGFGAYLVMKPEELLKKHGRGVTTAHKMSTRAIGVLAIAIGISGLMSSLP